MGVPWDDYLAVPANSRACRDCHLSCAPRFEPLRAVIRNALEKSAPGSVACLGAGLLNDIPYDTLLEIGATVHLVDWLPELVRSGIAQSIITRDPDGCPQCAYCLHDRDDARTYCRRFEPKGRAETEGVCDNFEPGPAGPSTCAAFEPGERPIIHGQDVTGGYATGFGRAVGEVADHAKSWRQALRQGSALAGRVKRHRTALDIPEGSVDFVTSSMVMSQFENEPYGFFARQITARLGAPTPQEEKRLHATLDGFRSELVMNQIERHCDEILRMLAPGGLCFMAFEMFHFDSARSVWFLVEEMHEAVKVLERRFDFDFDILPAADSVLRIDMLSGPSLIHAYALRPKRH